MESKLFVGLNHYIRVVGLIFYLMASRKALKVVDLKDILTKAEVAIGKANKPDLIAKILASPEALKVYEQQFGLPTTTNASESGTTLIAKPASTVQVRSSCPYCGRMLTVSEE